LSTGVNIVSLDEKFMQKKVLAKEDFGKLNVPF